MRRLRSYQASTAATISPGVLNTSLRFPPGIVEVDVRLWSDEARIRIAQTAVLPAVEPV
jgi:hypothetical protein